MAEVELNPFSDEEAAKICAHPPHESTKDFLFQQTMYRIKDPRRSLIFYSQVLGMTLLKKIDVTPLKFSLFFMGYEAKADIPHSSEKDQLVWTLTRKATLELTHNWGTENQPDFAYKIGNTDGIGYGHIGILVPDLEAACARFEAHGIEFVKKPDQGIMKGIAFIKDPDGYWIEIFSPVTIANLSN